MFFEPNMKLDELKLKYNELAKKYQLPNFSSLNGIFEIEKIDKDSDMLAKLIRKAMMDKIINTHAFFEGILNPVNTPRMYHLYLKSFNLQDKEDVEKIYSILSDLIFSSSELEIGYDESREAALISEIFKKWQELKPILLRVITRMRKPEIENQKKDRSYYG